MNFCKLSVAAVVLFACSKESPDRSLSMEEYYRLGVPSVEGHWTTTDTRAALDTLLKLKEKDFFSLPRKRSARSNQLYRKLISKENTINFSDGQGIDSVLKRLAVLYKDNDGQRKPGYYHVEHTGMLVYYIRVIDTLTVRTLSLSLDKSNVEARKAIRKFENEIVRVIGGLLAYQNTKILSDGDRIAISWSINKSVEHGWKDFSADTRRTLLHKLDSAAKQNSLREVKNNYSKLIKRLDQKTKTTTGVQGVNPSREQGTNGISR